MKKVIIILGPTAVGKSDVAIDLAIKINGEVISADSSQVYRHFDIGSGKITTEEMKGVRHHLIDILDFNEEFNVAIFKKKAEEAISDIFSRGKNAIICGGTGLYVKALVNGYNFFKVSKDETYRKSLEEIAKNEGVISLYNKLKELDPVRASKINQNDQLRIIRALEILNGHGEEIIDPPKYEYLTIILNKDREKLYERIGLRVDKMVESGLFEEIQNLINMGAGDKCGSFKAIGYKEIYDYLTNKTTSKEETIELIKKHSRNYAKRQLTWLRAIKDATWIENCSTEQSVQKIEGIFSNLNNN